MTEQQATEQPETDTPTVIENITGEDARATSPTPPPQRLGLALPVIYFCFFISGVAGLVYEVVWSRYLTLFLGSTGQAHAIILATYMGGLALGAALFGRRADRTPNPLRLYVLLEVGIGLFGALYPRIFPVIQYLFLAMVRALGLGAWSTSLAGALACTLTILLPTVLMGGTLPVLTRFLARRHRSIGRRIASLYTINSFGAVAGALLSGFYLIPAFGLALATLTAAGLNLLAALVARLLASRAPAFGIGHLTFDRSSIPHSAIRNLQSDIPHSAFRIPLSPGPARLALVVITLSGFTSMAYEVVWIRLLAMVLGSSSTSFALMLAAFITGITLGAFLLSLKRRDRGHYQILGWCELGIGLTTLLSMIAWQRLPALIFWLRGNLEPVAANFPVYQAILFVLCFGVMVVPTVFMGAALPAASRVVARGLGDLGRRVGDVYALNTLGTLAGALLTGMVLLPRLGLSRVVECAAALNVLLGFAVLCSYPRRHPTPRAMRWAGLGAAALTFAVYAAGFGALDIRPFSSAVFRSYDSIDLEKFRMGWERLRLLYHRDGNDATVSITRHASGQGQVTSLVINGKADASDGGDMFTQQMISHIPMLIHPAPRDVLVIGLGSGVSAGVVTLYEPRQVDCVELLPEVVETARFFKHVNYGVVTNPRVHLTVQDAKTHLQVSPGGYDVIISEPTNPWISGVAGLFTKEFYAMCRERLATGGLFVQWIQCYEMPDEAVYSILRTFNETFPYSTLFNINQGNMALVGSPAPFTPDLARMEGTAGRPAVAADLARAGIIGLLPILAMQMADKGDVPEPYVTSAGQLSDFYPALEYQAIRGLFTGSRASGVSALDCRGLAPGHANLWIERYRPAAPPPENVFTTYALKLASMKALYESMNHYWCSIWARFYPQSPLLRLTRLRLTREAAGRLAALEDPTLDPLPETLREKLELRLAEYKSWRNCVNKPDGGELVRLLEAALVRDPPVRCANLMQLGYVARDGGQLDRALDFFRQVLGILTDRSPQPVVIESALRREMIGDALLAAAETCALLGRWEEADGFIKSIAPQRLEDDGFNARVCRVRQLGARAGKK